MTVRTESEVRTEQAEQVAFARPLDKILEPWNTWSDSIGRKLDELNIAEGEKVTIFDPDSPLQKLYNAMVSEPRSYSPFDFAIAVVKTRHKHLWLEGTQEGDIRKFLADAATVTIKTIKLAEELVGNAEDYAGTTTSGLGNVRVFSPTVQNITGGEPLTGQDAITALRAFKRELRRKTKRKPSRASAAPAAATGWRPARRIP